MSLVKAHLDNSELCSLMKCYQRKISLKNCPFKFTQLFCNFSKSKNQPTTSRAMKVQLTFINSLEPMFLLPATSRSY